MQKVYAKGHLDMKFFFHNFILFYRKRENKIVIQKIKGKLSQNVKIGSNPT